jgi:ribA/ribD-fused uncharacterized protein
MNYKERRTDTHIYFVGGPFSQWYASPFEAEILDAGTHKFNCCEQYMMAGKALAFGDEDVFNAIMLATNPRDHKALGRQVRNFDADVWNQVAREIVYEGNIAKFTSTDTFKDYLLGTDDLYMVEGAIYDAVWGVKLAWDDPKIEDPANWQGTNWLGETLMRVRSTLNTECASTK